MKMDHRRAVPDPGHRSLRKAARTAAVMTVSFLVGIHVVHNAQFAVVATFTGAALLGIADFSGDRWQRLRATASTLAAGSVLLALGTAVSTDTAAASATMFAVTLIVGFSAVFSGYFAAASSAVIVFYVVATGVEGSTAVIAPREAGLAFGGGLSLLAAGWLWPSRSTAESRLALAGVYRALARQIGTLHPAPAGDAAPQGGASDGELEDELDRAVLEAERAIARSAWRPDGLAGPHKARMYMLQGARRISGLIGAFRRLPARSGTGLDDVTGELVDELASQLEGCAAGLATYGRSLPEPSRIDPPKERFTTAGHLRFADLLGTERDPGDLHAFAAWYFMLQQLSWGATLASIHCRAMHNAPLDTSVRSEQSALVQSLADGPSAAKWVRRARRNLSLGSVHLQNSVRLAAGLAIARLAVGVLGLEHGFWVGFATLVVLKTSAAGTRASAVQAAVGTAIGFAVSSVLITTFGVDALVYSIALPVVVFAAFYLPGTVSFVAGQACFTMVIVVLFNLLKPSGWTVGLVRLEDVLIGALIGLVIGMAIWPRGAGSELAATVGRLYSAGSRYAEATVGRLVGGVPGPGGPEPTDAARWHHQVCVAAVDTEDVFSQYLAEPHQSDAPVMAWAAVIATGHQLWFGSSLVALARAGTGVAGATPDACGELVSASASLGNRYRSVADTLSGRGPSTAVTVPAVGDAIDPSRPGATLAVLELGAWLVELGTDLDAVRPALGQLGYGPSVVPDPSAPTPPARRTGQVAGGAA